MSLLIGERGAFFFTVNTVGYWHNQMLYRPIRRISPNVQFYTKCAVLILNCAVVTEFLSASLYFSKRGAY